MLSSGLVRGLFLLFFTGIMVLTALTAGCAQRGTQVPEPDPDLPPGDGLVKLTGTFLQIDNSIAGLPDSALGRELDWMKAIGMDLIIVQYTGYEFGTGWIWWYPSSYNPSAADFIGKLLNMAQERGMEVFLGLSLPSAYWSGEHDVEEDLARNKKVAGELQQRYGNHPAFAGWYIPHEVSDWTFRQTDTFNEAVYTVSTLAQYLREISPGRPISIAPYYGDYLSESVYRQRWEQFLDQVGIDIIMLQDGVGTHRVGIDHIPKHYRALRQAIGDRPIQLWSDVEIFDQIHGWPVDDQPWAAVAATAERIVQQMEAAAPYVSRFVAFEFSHYMSPRLAQGVPFYNDYKAYLEGTK